jgi:hypothetical protein
MRNSAAAAALCLLAACDAGPTTPIQDAKAVAEDGVTLTVAVRGRGEVTHAADLAGATSCSTLAPGVEKADCVRSYALNTVVTLTAKPAPGFVFRNWSGPCSGTGTCTITMNEKRVVEAIFKGGTVSPPTPSNPTLLIAIRGRGTVTHTADQAGATSCGTVTTSAEKSDCVRSYALNTVVTLTAVAAPGYTFDHWGGPCTGKGTCTITMNEKRAVEAIFKAPVVVPANYTLKILVRGRGEVRHTPDVTGAAACTPSSATPDHAECGRIFAPNADVVLEAVPAAGWKFPGWAGPCASAGTGKCTLKSNENRVLEVRFTA